MSLADGRPIRHDQPTGGTCPRPVRDLSQKIGERACGAPTYRVTVRIPALISAVVCPICDVVNLA